MKKETEIDVPDSIRPYLNEIAERLWTRRAAVMVGAGFSKNAGKGFPDWNQLGDLFYEKAHGVKHDPESKQYLNVLRLAEEVQAAIGRPALENLLRSSIPDLDAEPSELHVELLELPWADVFTTNYDTLLERASARVMTLRYEPVVNKEDIPYAIKPRIVKLHGSFPSERPFIITEEDYRRYPYDYAPFVNTVQQSLLENTFCLIGFSGDDPNFLQWIGWIRDNLGRDNTQKIYLVGSLNLSSARQQLLAQRGVIAVDLSCCPGITKNDHKKALDHFFKYMQSKKPHGLDWPYASKTLYPSHNADRIEELRKITEEWREQRKAYPGWLVLPYENRQKLWDFTQHWVNYFPDTETSTPGLDVEYTFELIWRLERCLLPIFGDMDVLCEKLLKKYWPFQSEKPPVGCLFCAGEEMSRDLPWDDLRQAWMVIALAMLRFYREKGDIDKWKETESRLKRLGDYLSAEQWEFLKYEAFLFSLFTLDLIDARKHLENWRPNETQPYWMAKRAAALAEMNLCNELDDQIQLSLVYSRKKNKNDTGPPDYRTVSNEAYQMLLLRYVKDASNWILDKPATPEEEQMIKGIFESDWKKKEQGKESHYPPKNNTIKPTERFNSIEEDWDDLVKKRHDVRKQEWNLLLGIVRNNKRKHELQQQNIRRDELKSLRCDPWSELRLFALTLNNPSAQKKHFTEKREFDIGRVTRMRHFGSTDMQGLSAYAFLRFCEEVGLPFRLGDYTLQVETVQASLNLTLPYSSFWAMATLVRLGDVKAADRLFNRESVSRLTSNESDQLIQNYLNALQNCREQIQAYTIFQNDSYAARLAHLLPEIISRLCCKCSMETKHRILKFITDLYASPDRRFFQNVANLTRRLMNSMSELEQYTLVPNLLNIPFPEDLKRKREKEFLHPFLLIELNQKPEYAAPLQIPSGLTDHLFQQAGSDKPDHRCWAITSLVKLYELELLNKDEIKKFAEILWGRTDPYSLPDGTDYYKFYFMSLPYPEEIDPFQCFKNYVWDTSFPIEKGKKDGRVRMMGGNIPIVDEIIGAARDENLWTAEDAEKILRGLLEWWDADKENLNENEEESPPAFFPSRSEEFRSRFSRMAELLAHVVVPKLGPNFPADAKPSLARLLKEMRECKLPILEAEAASLAIYPEQKNMVYGRISEALVSSDDTIQRDALQAIFRILLNGLESGTDAMEPDPASMLSQYITWCPAYSVVSALWILISILKKSPSGFSNSLEAATLMRLDRLLSETAYDKDNPAMNFDEKVEVRRSSSILAATLWAHYKSRKAFVPDAVKKWREACLSPDEFSEIRNPWEDAGAYDREGH